MSCSAEQLNLRFVDEVLHLHWAWHTYIKRKSPQTMCSLRESKLKRAKRGILLPWEQFNKNRHSIAGIRKSHLFTCNCYSLLIKSQRCFNTVSVPKRVAVQTKSCVQTDQEQFKVRMQQTAIGSFNNALLMTRLIVLSSVCALACRAKTLVPAVIKVSSWQRIHSIHLGVRRTPIRVTCRHSIDLACTPND